MMKLRRGTKQVVMTLIYTTIK